MSHVASKKANLPILSNILLRAKDGRIELLATNLEIGMKTQVRGKVESEGEFTVPAQLIGSYVGLLPNERIDVVLQGSELVLSSQSSQTKIKGEPSSEFPLIPEIARTNKRVVAAKALLDGLSSVVVAAAIDDSRPELHGVLFQFSPAQLVLAATDSYRLAEANIGLQGISGEENRIIVPLQTVHELLRILQQDDAAEVEIYISDNQVLFVAGDVELTSRLVVGTYPDYKQIIPREYTTEVHVPIAEFVKVIKVASLFAKSGVNDVALAIEPANKQVKVSSVNNQLGENVSSVPISGTGEKNEVVFNYRFLLDGLNVISADEVSLQVMNNTTAGILRPKGSKGFLYIVMPIKQ